MKNTLEQEIQRLLAGMDEQQEQEPKTEPETDTPEENEPTAQLPGQEDTPDIQDIYVLVVRETAPEDPLENVVETTLVSRSKKTDTKRRPDYLTLWIVLICCLPMLTSIAFQVYVLFHPPIATVTIIPKSQQVTLSGTLQLGRILFPLTLSQSQTTATTGRGHQDAKQAQGYITFYNGQFQTITVPAGTVLTGADGIQVITDQDTTIPPGNPPSYGEVTISAHAINPGVKGNIPAYDINQIFSNAVLVKNTTPFYNGQDKRNYQTVTKADTSSVATPLKIAVAQSMQGALTGQLISGEALISSNCTPTATTNHQPGQEATLVKVTVTETCSAVAYNPQELTNITTQLLTTQAAKKLGTGYSLIGQVQVSVKDATITHTTTPLVFLSFHAQGTWVYALNTQEQQQMKHLIAGKTTQSAMQILASLPGVEHSTISFDGFGDDTKLPKNSTYIHISLLVV